MQWDHVRHDQRRGAVYSPGGCSFSIERNGHSHLSGGRHRYCKFGYYGRFVFNYFSRGFTHPGCARDRRPAAVFRQSCRFFEHVSDLGNQRYWLRKQFLRFDQFLRALHRSQQRSHIFRDYDYGGVGRQSYQVRIGLAGCAIRVLGYSFSFAKDCAGRHGRKTPVLCNGERKHKSCCAVERFGNNLQRRSLWHDHSCGALLGARNAAYVSFNYG